MDNTPLPSPPPTLNSNQKFCHACAKVLHVSASLCPSCGAHQAGTQLPAPISQPSPTLAYKPVTPERTRADQRHCHGCGHIVHASAPACPKCGARQAGVGAALSPGSPTLKSRIAGVLLAFFLGGLGIHKFYCGKVGMGFLYLIFFWTWIPALIALVEGIVFLTNSNSDEEFTQKFCV